MSDHAIDTPLSSFDAIGLESMDRVKLMNRIDTKFAFDKNTLIQLLPKLKDHYFVLEINNKRALAYESLYFDDAEFSFFKDHHNRRSNRYKMRIRNYVDSGIYFFEIKHKSKGRTDKQRISTPNFHDVLTPEEEHLVRDHVHKSYKVSPVLTNAFNRITLVNKHTNERLTLDFNLSFSKGSSIVALTSLVIAELKQERINRRSPFFEQMKENHLRPYRLSKYCLGVMELLGEEKPKANRFKRKLQYLEKINLHAA
ncbi:MAG: polyphosphate polymerase domain-containing protein [Flavobacteriales bacterium]